MSVELWPHQGVARDRIESAWARGVQRPAIVHATGAGKTSTFVSAMLRWLDRNPGRRGLVVVDRQELADQAYERFCQFGMRPGIVMGTRNQTLPPIIIGSMQTLANERRRRMLRGVKLVTVDECQIGTTPSVRVILDWAGCMTPGSGAVALGVTATMSRADGAALGDIWQDVVHTYTIAEGIVDGRLVRPVGIRVRVDDLDLRKVKRVGGANSDYRDGSLGEAITDSMAPKKIVEAYTEHVPNEPGFVFAPTVASATVIRDAFRAGGYVAELVHATTPKEERRAIIRRFKDGLVQILCNVGVFMKGTDLPRASVCVLARPTVHDGTYIQMVGRVLRVCAGKTGAWVLDVVGATRMHSLHARIELFGAAQAAEIEGVEVEDELVLDDELIIPPADINVGRLDVPETYADGMLVSEIIDLFKASKARWAQTAAGVWHLEAGDRLIAVLPSKPRYPGDWAFDVIAMHRHRPGESAWVRQYAPNLAEAMVAAESAVTPKERRQRLTYQSMTWTPTDRIDPFIPAYARF